MFAIDRKILDEKFLRKLAMEGCLPAFFVLKNRIGRSNPKKIEWLLKYLPKHSYDRISKTDSLQELEFRKKLLPISKKKSRKFYKLYNQSIKNINKIIIENQENELYSVIDLYSIFVNNRGQLINKLTNDGLHLNEKGYKLWSKFIKPITDSL